MSKISTARSIWSKNGTIPLLRETVRWLYRRPYEKFSDYRGYQYFRIGDVTAEFGTANREAITMLRLIYRWEKDIVAQILATLRADDIFFDIGANLGLYTAFASHKVPEGSVVAFEPHPPNVSELSANAKRNGTNIDIHDIALSDSWGTASFQQSKPVRKSERYLHRVMTLLMKSKQRP